MKVCRKSLILLLLAIVLLFSSVTEAFAEKTNYSNWGEVADAMEVVLREGLKAYEDDNEKNWRIAYDSVNDAYFKYYEKIGFEAVTMSTISGKRGSLVENQFYMAKRSAKKKVDVEEMKKEVETLITYLHEDADTLDEMSGVKKDTKAKKSKNSTGYSNWGEVADDMEVVLREGLKAYEDDRENNWRIAYDSVNDAYFKYYEKIGFEAVTMSTISGKRGSLVENQFYMAKRSAKNKVDVEEMKKEVETLITYLHEDADTLDEMSGAKNNTNTDAGVSAGSKSNGIGVFVSVLVLTLREGLEAILVISAIVAYLVKTNARKYLKSVYFGAGLGVIFSIVLAIIFNLLAAVLGDGTSGFGQEIFEGITMFIAVVVLFYVSNWMLSKAESEVWSKYIKSQVNDSLSKGNVAALVFSAFIAVAREGAELILFFQGLRTVVAENPTYMWAALAVSIIILAVVYLLIVKLGVRLPLKPFFMATSVLMFVMCVSFIGKGVYELQEADVIDRTIITAMNGFTIDLLGIYDRLETIIPQILLVVIIVITFILQMNKNKKMLQDATADKE